MTAAVTAARWWVAQGGSCGFGMRGQKSRSGSGTRPGFEGGQTSLYRRIPKLRGIAGGTCFCGLNHSTQTSAVPVIRGLCSWVASPWSSPHPGAAPTWGMSSDAPRNRLHCSLETALCTRQFLGIGGSWPHTLRVFTPCVPCCPGRLQLALPPTFLSSFLESSPMLAALHVCIEPMLLTRLTCEDQAAASY